MSPSLIPVETGIFFVKLSLTFMKVLLRTCYYECIYYLQIAMIKYSIIRRCALAARSIRILLMIRIVAQARSLTFHVF